MVLLKSPLLKKCGNDISVGEKSAVLVFYTPQNQVFEKIYLFFKNSMSIVWINI